MSLREISLTGIIIWLARNSRFTCSADFQLSRSSCYRLGGSSDLGGRAHWTSLSGEQTVDKTIARLTGVSADSGGLADRENHAYYGSINMHAL